MLSFEKIQTDERLENTAALADEIWRQHFSSILSAEQIDYMLEKFQSFSAMKAQIADGYEYYGFYLDTEQIGYFAICEKPDNTLFLSKLYLRQEHRGKGYASEAFELIKNIGRKSGNSMLWLTVNRHNGNSIAVYKRWGMEVIRTEVTDIGSGFIMDDYVFGLKL